MELLHRKATPAGVNLIVRMPNGIAQAIREWMTHPEAGLIPIGDRPRLPREALSDLRAVVDTLLGRAEPPEADLYPARSGKRRRCLATTGAFRISAHSCRVHG